MTIKPYNGASGVDKSLRDTAQGIKKAASKSNKINKMAIENKKLSNENTYLIVDYSAMLSRNSITSISLPNTG